MHGALFIIILLTVFFGVILWVTDFFRRPLRVLFVVVLEVIVALLPF